MTRRYSPVGTRVSLLMQRPLPELMYGCYETIHRGEPTIYRCLQIKKSALMIDYLELIHRSQI